MLTRCLLPGEDGQSLWTRRGAMLRWWFRGREAPLFGLLCVISHAKLPSDSAFNLCWCDFALPTWEACGDSLIRQNMSNGPIGDKRSDPGNAPLSFFHDGQNVIFSYLVFLAHSLIGRAMFKSWVSPKLYVSNSSDLKHIILAPFIHFASSSVWSSHGPSFFLFYA